MRSFRTAPANIAVLVGTLTLSAHTQTISLSVNVRTDNPGGDLNQLVPGDQVWFDVAVAVDPTADPNGQGNGNRGLAFVVYDVISTEAKFVGLFMEPMVDAPSGLNVMGNPVTVPEAYYSASPSSTQPNYGGGWGFTRFGLPGGGDVTCCPGIINAAGINVPVTYIADANPNFPGFQPSARLDVGVGLYTFPPDDFIAGGLQGGFGQDFSNINNIIAGDGSWFFQTGHIDTYGWEPGTYPFDITPGAGAVFNGGLDYTTDISGGFRMPVDPADMAGTSFSFTLIETCSSTCGDINGSGGLVNLFDFAALALCFGESAPASQVCACSDLNSDGSINMFDFATFALLFGSSSTNLPPNCP